jgi:RNA polymerase sigma-70 factor (ECF subfamily)
VTTRDDGYQEAVSRFGPALDRLARAYEADPEKRRDLLQDIHFAIWQSFDGFDGRCSLRTWIYRVAHNVATSHVTRAFRLRRQQFVTLNALDAAPARHAPSVEEAVDRRRVLARLYELIQCLEPIDRQIMLSYLDGLEAADTADIVGISAGAVAMKVHRIKRLLAQTLAQGVTHDR